MIKIGQCNRIVKGKTYNELVVLDI